jgi:DNA polymerase-3 subunit epsilon
MTGERISAWLARLSGRDRPRDARDAPAAERIVVLDVETTGLDTRRDRLLAVGTVAVVSGAVVVADSLEIVVRGGGTSDRANILVHGIGELAQRNGVDPGEACRAFVGHVGSSPIAAFHAPFDRAFVDRALEAALGRRLPNRWIDVARLAPVLCPQVRADTLDEWLSHFGLRAEDRHNPGGDALATAELLIRLMGLLSPRERGAAALSRIVGQARWLGN